MRSAKYGIASLLQDFPHEEHCLTFLFDSLHSRTCSCGGRYSLLKGRKQFQCSRCRYQIAPAAGTIFHKSSTPLFLWFRAILIFSNAKSGISAKELERELEVTYKCAYRILKEIKKALQQETTPLEGEVELDAAYIGGVKRGRQKHIHEDKAFVLTAIERNGTMRAKVVPTISGSVTRAFIETHIDKRATLYTDASPTYWGLKEYKRRAINHSHSYGKGKNHINRVESFFGHLKRSMRGTFKSVSHQHLQSYLDAFVFHYNNRGNDRDRFEVLLGVLLQPAG